MLSYVESSRLQVGGRSLVENQRVVLITVHRRENFGIGLRRIIQAVSILVDRFPDAAFVWPVHRNPQVREAVFSGLKSRSNLALIDPLPYSMFALLARTTVVITDSGGIQEEATYLQIPMVIARDQTERPEAIHTDRVEIVGTVPDQIVDAVSLHLNAQPSSPRSTTAPCPFGDGYAAPRIVDWVLQRFR